MGTYKHGIYTPALGEVGWDTELDDTLRQLSSQWVNPTAAPYGADPTGVADSTAAIQNAIDDAMGGPMSGTVPTPSRGGYAGTGKVFVPAGFYKITSPLIFRGVQGLTFEGAGKQATFFLISANMTSAFSMDGVSFSQFRNFCVYGADNGYQVTSALRLDWDPAVTVGSSSRNTFENVWVTNLNFVNGFSIGVNSTSYDVSATQFFGCFVAGGFTQGSGNTTRYQAGFMLGSGVGGNVLNMYFKGCIVFNTRRSFNINWVSNVTLENSEAAYCEDYVFKAGFGEVIIRDVRIENMWRLADTAGGAGYFSHMSVDGLQWSPGPNGSADGQFIRWRYGGTVSIRNSYLEIPQNNSLVQHVYAASPAGAAYKVLVLVDGVSVAGLTSVASFVEAAGSCHAELRAFGLHRGDLSDAAVEAVDDTHVAYNDNARLTLGSTEAVGSAGTDSYASMLRLASAADASASLAAVVWSSGPNDKWQLYKLAADPNLYLRDLTNSRMIATFRPGADVRSSNLELNGTLIMPEVASDPAAPLANTGVTFTRDNGSGKTQLCVRFNTGAVQVIATEP